ncbi:hypothetical protein [Marinimicrobium agarilyticum]|uniref:hypothetical protein n=1 Tax=Marinimicrobium agarilyticum TaxID=306546 RepID=UPI0012F70689|nr:hypothetical protein [Marinimicrobium agarilyticum]
MKKIVNFMVVLFLLCPLYGYSSEEGISNVVDAFSLSIKEKDKSKFLSLFVEKGVSWIGVFSEEEYQGLNKNSEGQGNVPGKLFHGSPEQFIDWVVGLEGDPREEFENIKIFTDGNVASVYFEYKFYLNGDLQNWGDESWLLVKSEAGWKIQAVNFSYTSGN